MKKRIIQCLVIIIAVLFLIILFWKNWNEISRFDWRIDYFYLGLSVLWLFSMFFCGSWGWALILKRIGIKTSFRKSMEIWVASLIGKYIPGKIWFFLGRIYLGQKLGIPKAKMSLACLLEIILMQTSGIIIFFISLLFWQQESFLNRIGPFLAIFCLLSLIGMHPRVLQRVVNLLLGILKREEISIAITYKDILSLLSFYLLFWLNFGVSIFFLMKAFHPVTITALPAISGIWAVSVTLGVMAFIVPGGLGVREGIVVFLLSFLVPTHIALLIAIFSRIILTILEIAFIGALLHFDVSLSKYYQEIRFTLLQQPVQP